MKNPQKTSPSILVLTYYWPPSGGSGVQRWVYFCKYLQQFGWDVSVVTVDPKYASYPVIDLSLCKYISSVESHKTKSFEALTLYRLLHFRKKRRLPQGEISTKGLFNKVLAFIRGNFFIPDARRGWNSYALKKANQILKKKSIQYLVTTGPPHSTHLVGIKLVDRYKLKWLADFRDPWTDLFYNQQLYRLPWVKKRDAQLERKVLNKADGILTTIGGNLHKNLSNRISKNQRFFSVPNGFDHELIEQICPNKSLKFHIAYTGVLTNNHSFMCIIEVLEILQSRYPNQFVLSLAGNIRPSIISIISKRLKHITVRDLGYISHSKSIELIKSAHLLLAFSFRRHRNEMISGKLLEYLASGTPMIVIDNPDSPAGRIVVQSTVSLICMDNDYNKIHDFIQRLIDSWIAKRSLSNQFNNISEYSRKRLTKDLEKVLYNL